MVRFEARGTLLAIALLLSTTISALAAGQLTQIQANGDVVSDANPLPIKAEASAGTTSVNIAQVNGATIVTGHGTAAGAVRVELPTDGTGTVGLNAGTQVIGHVIVDSGTIAATQSGTWTIQPGNTANTTAWLTSPPTTTGMYTANITNSATAANASPTTLYSINVGNTNASFCYLQVWNVAAGSVTVGVTAPYASFPIPANAAGTPIPLPRPIRFGTALTVAATTTRAGSTACTSGLDVNLQNE